MVQIHSPRPINLWKVDLQVQDQRPVSSHSIQSVRFRRQEFIRGQHEVANSHVPLGIASSTTTQSNSAGTCASLCGTTLLGRRPVVRNN